MYLNIIFIPIISLIISFIVANFIGRRGVLFISLIYIFFTMILVWCGFFDISISNNIIIYSLGSWINLGSFSLEWTFIFDSLTISMLLIIVTISFLVHLYSVSYMRNDPYISRFFIYLTAFTTFMIILVTSGNILILFLGWEGVGLLSYLLVNFWFTRKEANKSALKAIIINRFGDFGVLIAIIYLIDLFSSLDFLIFYSLCESILSSLDSNNYLYLYIIGIGVLVGAIGKSAQIGLHIWLPDAMEGPTPVSALIHAATMVTAGVFLILRCSVLFSLVPEVLVYMVVIGSFSALFAATVGVVQTDIKKIIAYSTCSQLGYMIFSCGVSNYVGSLFHLINHAFFKALLFLGAGIIIHALIEEQDIRKMGGLVNYLPCIYGFFLIGSFSLIGFPFLSGFYSKDLLIEFSYITYTFEGYFSFLIGSIVAGITAFYSFKLIYFVFLGKINLSFFKLKTLYYYDYYNFSALILLVIGSIFSGYFLKDLLLGNGTIFWNNALFLSPVGDYFSTLSTLDFFYKIFPFSLSLSGIFIVYIIYYKCTKFFYNYLFSKYFRMIYLFFSKAWYFNVLYNYFIGKKLLNYSYNVFYRLIDKGILEYFGPLGLGKFFNSFNLFFEIIHCGKYYSYILTMLYFIVFFLMFFLTFFFLI